MKTQDVEVIKAVEDELRIEKEEAQEKEKEKRKQEYLHKKRILKRVFPYILLLILLLFYLYRNGKRNPALTVSQVSRLLNLDVGQQCDLDMTDPSFFDTRTFAFHTQKYQQPRKESIRKSFPKLGLLSVIPLGLKEEEGLLNVPPPPEEVDDSIDKEYLKKMEKEAAKCRRDKLAVDDDLIQTDEQRELFVNYMRPQTRAPPVKKQSLTMFQSAWNHACGTENTFPQTVAPPAIPSPRPKEDFNLYVTNGQSFSASSTGKLFNNNPPLQRPVTADITILNRSHTNTQSLPDIRTRPKTSWAIKSTITGKMLHRNTRSVNLLHKTKLTPSSLSPPPSNNQTTN